MRQPFVTGLVLLTALFASPCSTAQTGWDFQDTPPGHRGAVRALCYDGETLLSAGEDGFLEYWNVKTKDARQRFQLSPYRISHMALRPGKRQIGIVENDGIGFYRLSVWDYAEKKRFFTLQFRDPVTYINYSAGGNFLIATRTGRTGLVFIHPETGEVLQSPQISGAVSLAATGRSERSMLAYSSGVLSYWDLAAGTETQHFPLGAALSSPIVFSNNRYLAGFDASSLVVFDAVSGKLLAKENAGRRGILIPVGPASSEFYSLDTGKLSRFRLSASNRLEQIASRELPAGEFVSSVFLEGGSVALGSAAGEVWVVPEQGQSYPLEVKPQELIQEAAVSGGTIAFLCNGGLGFIPLNFAEITDQEELVVGKAGPYTRIAGTGVDNEIKFLLWQQDNTRTFPVIKKPDGQDQLLDKLPYRHRLLAAAIHGDKLLFLDSAGTITVFSESTRKTVFSFSSIGSMDAAFTGKESIILGRSAVSGNTPFLLINFTTGETVPLNYPASAGGRVYAGPSGRVYAAAVEEMGETEKTSIVRLDLANPALSAPLVEYQGEDTLLSMAEANGFLASNLGGDEASIYSGDEIKLFQRQGGIPSKIAGGGSYFIAVDGDGKLCWYEASSGRLLAVFRLYKDSWALQEAGGRTSGGKVRQEG